MPDLAYVKLVLGRGSEVAGSLGMSMLRVNSILQNNRTITRGVYDDLGSMLGLIGSTMNDLTEQRNAIIVATQGHQVQAPVIALNLIDQALAKLRELLTKIIIARARLNEGMDTLAQTDDIANEASVLLAGAASRLDQYRTSF